MRIMSAVTALHAKLNTAQHLARSAPSPSIAENQRQINFWENYLHNLRNLDLNYFLNNIKVPSLIPIGSRIFFRGDLIHTNEFTVALGANYFTKCSASQAEVLKQHRILGVQEKLSLLSKELNYLENQLSFTQKNILDESGQEIIESYSEEQESLWKIKHKENIKKHKQESASRPEESNYDDDLWNRLDQLELQEELEEHSELLNVHNKDKSEHSDIINTDNKQQHVQDLKNALLQLASKKTAIISKEENMLKILDTLEEQEALEEELDRLESNGGDPQEAEDDHEMVLNESKKKTLSFASDDEPFCIKINFKHSEISPDLSEYSEYGGIKKPSDIYAAFPENFKEKPIIPILKKSTYVQPEEILISKPNSTSLKIKNVIGEVIEHTEHESKIIETTSRPPSKFKAMRIKKL